MVTKIVMKITEWVFYASVIYIILAAYYMAIKYLNDFQFTLSMLCTLTFGWLMQITYDKTN